MQKVQLCKGQRQERTQHIQEPAKAGAQSRQAEGEEVSHEHPQAYSARGPEGLLRGGEEPATPSAQAQNSLQKVVQVRGT